MKNINAKIVLVGGGSSATMAKKTCELCIRKPHVVILPTARFDDSELIHETKNFYGQFAESVDVVELISESPSKEDVRNRIMKADLIYIPGGSSEAILKTWKKFDADKAIFDFAAKEDKVIVGSSAGAMVLSYSCIEIDFGEKYYGGYQLIPAWFSPHYQLADWKKFDNFLETQSDPALAFSAGDDAGVLCTPDGKYYTIFGDEKNSVWRFVYNKGSKIWERSEYYPDRVVDITP